MVEIKGSDLRADLRALRFGDAARQWLDASVSTLHQMFTPGVALAAADGGRAVDAVSDQLDDEGWRRAHEKFLMCDAL